MLPPPVLRPHRSATAFSVAIYGGDHVTKLLMEGPSVIPGEPQITLPAHPVQVPPYAGPLFEEPTLYSSSCSLAWLAPLPWGRPLIGALPLTAFFSSAPDTPLSSEKNWIKKRQVLLVHSSQS